MKLSNDKKKKNEECEETPRQDTIYSLQVLANVIKNEEWSNFSRRKMRYHRWKELMCVSVSTRRVSNFEKEMTRRY